MLPGSVALTYDGGPDPAWTPRLLDLLREHHAKATFFLTGTEAAAHPDLVRRIKDEGHEIGSHTYTDADLGSVSGIRAGLELSLTQNTLAGTAGVGTPLLRLPHTSTTESLCGEQWEAGRRAILDGYVLVAADGPGRSPERGTIRQFTGSAEAVTQTGKLFRTAAGDDLTYTTVSKGLGQPSAVYEVSTLSEWRGTAVVLAQQGSRAFADGMTWLLAVAGVLTLLRLVLLLTVARVHVKRVRAKQAGAAARCACPRSPIRSR